MLRRKVYNKWLIILLIYFENTIKYNLYISTILYKNLRKKTVSLFNDIKYFILIKLFIRINYEIIFFFGTYY